MAPTWTRVDVTWPPAKTRTTPVDPLAARVTAELGTVTTLLAVAVTTETVASAPEASDSGAPVSDTTTG
jgi:hypothetical protein